MSIVDRIRSFFTTKSVRKDDHYSPARSGIFTGGKARSDYTWSGTFGVDYNRIREGMRAAFVDSVQLQALVKRIGENAVNTGLYPEPKPVYDLVAPEFAYEERAAWERAVWMRFDLWARSTDATANRSMTFYELERYAIERKLIDGEVFIVVRYLSGMDRMSPVAVQIMEPAQCMSPYSAPDIAAIKARGNRVIDGIEVDGLGLPVAYWFQDQDSRNFTRIPTMGPRSGRVFVIHSPYLSVPGTLRGISPMAAVLHELEKITDYSVAELQAAVVNATIAAWVEPSENQDSSRPLSGVIRRDSATTTDTLRREDNPSIAALDSAGVLVQNLKAGEKLHSYDTRRPNVNFDTFVSAVMKHISASQGVPVEVLNMTFAQNYSASRASLLLFWNTIRVHRGDLESWLLNPLYQQWLAEEVAAGNIGAPGLSTVVGRRAWSRCNWIGINHPSIDPLKEANAAVVRISEGLSTRDREAAAYNGTDFSDNVAELAIENAQLADANAPLETAVMIEEDDEE